MCNGIKPSACFCSGDWHKAINGVHSSCILVHCCFSSSEILVVCVLVLSQTPYFPFLLLLRYRKLFIHLAGKKHETSILSVKVKLIWWWYTSYFIHFIFHISYTSYFIHFIYNLYFLLWFCIIKVPFNASDTGSLMTAVSRKI